MGDRHVIIKMPLLPLCDIMKPGVYRKEGGGKSKAIWHLRHRIEHIVIAACRNIVFGTLCHFIYLATRYLGAIYML